MKLLASEARELVGSHFKVRETCNRVPAKFLWEMEDYPSVVFIEESLGKARQFGYESGEFTDLDEAKLEARKRTVVWDATNMVNLINYRKRFAFSIRINKFLGDATAKSKRINNEVAALDQRITNLMTKKYPDLFEVKMLPEFPEMVSVRPFPLNFKNMTCYEAVSANHEFVIRQHRMELNYVTDDRDVTMSTDKDREIYDFEVVLSAVNSEGKLAGRLHKWDETDGSFKSDYRGRFRTTNSGSAEHFLRNEAAKIYKQIKPWI